MEFGGFCVYVLHVRELYSTSCQYVVHAQEQNAVRTAVWSLGCAVLRLSDGLAKSARPPSHRVRGGITEHPDKKSRKDCLGFGIGPGAQAAKQIGVIEDFDNSILFGKGGQVQFMRPEFIEDYTWHLCASYILRGVVQEPRGAQVVSEVCADDEARPRLKRNQLASGNPRFIWKYDFVQVRPQLGIQNVALIEVVCRSPGGGRACPMLVEYDAGVTLDLVETEVPYEIGRAKGIRRRHRRCDNSKRIERPNAHVS